MNEPLLVPSPAVPDGRAALRSLIRDGCAVRAAVAFVSDAGVRALAEVLADHRDVSLEIVARAADATSPQALIALRDDLGGAVSVVIGRHAQAFHPKLWLVESDDELAVLSGSGNLTQGGLVTNDEQFELTSTPAGGALAIAHTERFEQLTLHAIALDAVEDTAIWREWLAVIKQQELHTRELERLQRNLNHRDPVPDRAADLAQLIEDLDDLYTRTVAAHLPRDDGGHYVPTRFKQGIDRARAGADPVRLVTQICRKQSKGFDVLLNADRPDLTVERLVLDPTRPYHDLFKSKTRELSAERLKQFPSWPRD